MCAAQGSRLLYSDEPTDTPHGDLPDLAMARPIRIGRLSSLSNDEPTDTPAVAARQTDYSDDGDGPCLNDTALFAYYGGFLGPRCGLAAASSASATTA